ncbi:hypothetical protein K438DRAFT_1768327 [Mycena galopus ATCC 62051]|nr:hypothetical protein K438DRAFT_1768327 [Mycena galopus ATCC 62051]
MSTSSSSSSNASLSEADAQALYLYGRNTLQDAFGVIWETMLISVYGVFFAVAVYSIFRKGLKSRGSIAMLCVIRTLSAATRRSLGAKRATKLLKSFIRNNKGRQRRALLRQRAICRAHLDNVLPQRPMAGRKGEADEQRVGIG